MRLFDLTKKIEAIASEFPNVNYIEETGDIYQLNAHQNVEYTVFCALPQGVSITDNLDGTQTLNNNYTLIYVDRLQNDQKNKLAIWSNGEDFFKYLLQRLYDEYGITYSNYSSTNFTERFNDDCAGVYVTLSIDVNEDAECFTTFDEVEDINKQIRERLNQINGTNQGKTIMEKLDVTDSLREQLAANINYKGVPTSENEGLNTLVPKVREIESVNLTPVNTLLDSDLGCFVQKYYDADYPVIIAYTVLPWQVDYAYFPFTSPYNCNHVVINGETFSIASGSTITIDKPTAVMYCWSDGTDITDLLSPYPIQGNMGQILDVYCLKTNINYIERSLNINVEGTAASYVRKFHLVSDGDVTFQNTQNFTNSSNMDIFIWSGITSFTSNIRGITLGGYKKVYFPNLKRINCTNSSPGSFIFISGGRFAPSDTDVLFPQLEWVEGNMLAIGTEYQGTTRDFHFSKLQHWNAKNTYPLKAAKISSPEYFTSGFTCKLTMPSMTEFTLASMGNTTTANPHIPLTDMILGKLTLFNWDTRPIRSYILRNVVVGEDTDIDLNLIGWGAGAYTNLDLMETTQHIEDECLAIITNIRNGLLNKVKDHSTDGETRTITLTNLITNFSTNATPAVVTALNQLIQDFNNKGWTVI